MVILLFRDRYRRTGMSFMGIHGLSIAWEFRGMIEELGWLVVSNDDGVHEFDY